MRIALLLIIASALVQPLAATDSFPLLEPHRAKYARDRQFLGEAHMREIEAVQPHYLDALHAAREEAVKADQSKAVAAIDAELHKLRPTRFAPATLAPEMPDDLPPSLAEVRREFVSNADGIGTIDARKSSELRTRYGVVLSWLEEIATDEKNGPLAEAIRVEKSRLDEANAGTTLAASKRAELDETRIAGGKPASTPSPAAAELRAVQRPASVEQRFQQGDLSLALAQYEKLRMAAFEIRLKLLIEPPADDKQRDELAKRGNVLEYQAAKLRAMTVERGETAVVPDEDEKSLGRFNRGLGRRF